MNRVLAHTGARYPIVQAPMGLMAPDALKGIRDVYFHGDMEAAPALAGQSAGLIDAVKSAQHIIEETVAQFAITGRLGGLATTHRFG